MKWPRNKQQENLEERLRDIEDVLYENAQQGTTYDDIGIRISCIDRAITTLVNHDNVLKISAKEITAQAKEYYKYITENVSTGDNK